MITPAPPDPYAMRSRLDELRAEADPEIARQHVVSKVILRRFTNSDRLLQPVSVTDPEAPNRLIGPAGVGWEHSFIPRASASAERLWGTVENGLGQVIRRCAARVPLSVADLDLLKLAIVLHYVRNPKSLVPHQQSYVG